MQVVDIPQSVDEFREFVLREMRDRTAQGLATPVAAQAVLDVIEHRGMSTLYARAIGYEPLVSLYISANASARKPSNGDKNQRRIGSILNPEDSVLEGEWPIGERWMKLGDMGEKDLAEIAAYYGKMANGFLLKQDFFKALRTPLKKAERVRDRWTEEDVLKIYPAE